LRGINETEAAAAALTFTNVRRFISYFEIRVTLPKTGKVGSEKTAEIMVCLRGETEAPIRKS
jgi:hypothetical protein